MGLAAAKNKRKLGNDPNNTKWSRNTDTFGQKILRAQGWQPGQYLGAKDAPHAEWHTEASSSHIRVVLKDDTMGLGAKRNNGDECVGLDAFQMLLGRLNGKSDETLETERKVREDMKLNLYVERKLGAIRFVRGGWLVGDQLQQTPDEEAAKSETSPVPEESKEPTEEKESEPAGERSKKRKADDSTDAEDEKARKKEKKSKKRKADFEAEVDSESTKEKKDKKDKKSKKRRSEDDTSSKKSKKDKKDVSEDSSVSETGEDLTEADTSAADAKKAKKEKKDRKKRKKEKKEKKEKRKKDKAGSDAETGDSISKEKKRKKDDGEASSASTPAESTPSGSGYSTPVTTSTRYLARSRFIAQKRMAFADSAALNQIFMIKS